MTVETIPGVTSNAILLLGYIAGALTRDGTTYEIVEIQAADGTQTVRNAANGNLYRVSVIQLEGQA